MRNRWIVRMSSAKLVVGLASVVGALWVFGGLGMDIGCTSGGIASDLVSSGPEADLTPYPTAVPEPTPVSVGRLALEEAMGNMRDVSSYRFRIQSVGSSIVSEGYAIGSDRMAARLERGEATIGWVARFDDDYFFSPAMPADLENANPSEGEGGEPESGQAEVGEGGEVANAEVGERTDSSAEFAGDKGTDTDGEDKEPAGFGDVPRWLAVGDSASLSRLLPVDPGRLLSDPQLFLDSTDSEFAEDGNSVEWLLSGLLSPEFLGDAALDRKIASLPTQFHLKSVQIGRDFIPTMLRVYPDGGQMDVAISLSEYDVPIDDLAVRPAEPGTPADAEIAALIEVALDRASLAEAVAETERQRLAVAEESRSAGTLGAGSAANPELPAGFGSAEADTAGWRRYWSAYIGVSVEIPSGLAVLAETGPAEATRVVDSEGPLVIGPFREVSGTLRFYDPLDPDGMSVRLASRTSADTLSLAEAVDAYRSGLSGESLENYSARVFALPVFSGALMEFWPEGGRDEGTDPVRVYLFEADSGLYAELELRSVPDDAADRIVGSLDSVGLAADPIDP